MATTNKILNQPANNSSNWDTPLNSNFAIIDSALGSATSISVSGVGTGATALTSAQYQCMSFKFSGTLSNSVNYQLPSGVGGLFVVQNSTTGAYDLVISSAGGGTSATVVQGTTRIVYCDGTNVIFSDSSAGGTFTAGSDTQIIFNSAGTLVGDADLTFTAATNTLTTGIISASDGSASAPAFTNTGDANTGIYFPAANAVGISTDGSVRFYFGSNGQLGIGGATYGTSGYFLMSGGSSAAPSWNQPIVLLSTTTSTSTTWSIGGLSLGPYKFLRIVLDGLSHNSGSAREITFGATPTTVTASLNAGNTCYGPLLLDLTTGVVSASTGVATGGLPYGGGGNTSYTTASTSISFALSGGGSFDSGTIYVYGIR